MKIATTAVSRLYPFVRFTFMKCSFINNGVFRSEKMVIIALMITHPLCGFLFAKLIRHRCIQNASLKKKCFSLQKKKFYNTTGKFIINKNRVTLTYLPLIVNIKVKLF